MKNSELFWNIKKNMERYRFIVNRTSECLNKNDSSAQCAMSRYNLENFDEILNSNPEELDDEVDEKELKDLEERIDYYFSLHASDDEEFKEFIKMISEYLIFIAKKPLHPPGIEFSDGNTVYKKGDSYHCTGKRVYIKEKNSICKHCIAQ